MLDPIIQEIQGILGVNLTQKSPVIRLLCQLTGQDMEKDQCIHAVEALVFDLNYLTHNNMRIETHRLQFITLLRILREILDLVPTLNMRHTGSLRNTVLLNRTFIKLKICADKLDNKLSDIPHPLGFGHIIQWRFPCANTSQRPIRSGGIELATHTDSDNNIHEQHDSLLDNNRNYSCNPFKFRFF